MTATVDVKVTREIAETAKVSQKARIGAFSVIGPHVVIGPGTVIGRGSTVVGHTTIGRDNVFGDGCVLGALPQDLKYAGEETYLLIGDRNRIEAKVTAHVGTGSGGFLTRIGSDNHLGAFTHIAHDCFVDDRTRLGHGVLLAGHVRVEDGAVVEDFTGAHHFTTIGRYSRVGGGTPVRRDVPPFTQYWAVGHYEVRGMIRGAHEAGLAAAGLGADEQALLREAIRFLFEDENALAVKAQRLMDGGGLTPSVQVLCEFCQASLSGKFGRCRELFRGKLPLESRAYLPPAALARIDAGGSA